MPIVRRKWEDVPEREKRNEHYGKEEFEQFQDELERLADAARASLSPEKFSEWLKNSNLSWVD
jgi:hypothetical protein